MQSSTSRICSRVFRLRFRGKLSAASFLLVMSQALLAGDQECTNRQHPPCFPPTVWGRVLFTDYQKQREMETNSQSLAFQLEVVIKLFRVETQLSPDCFLTKNSPLTIFLLLRRALHLLDPQLLRSPEPWS